MKIIRTLSQEHRLNPDRSVLTIGSYDGIHRGHKRIIANLKQAANFYEVSSALITFYPRPRVVLSSQSEANYLTTVDEKSLILEDLGLDFVAILPFTHEFAQTPAQEFVEQLVSVFRPLELWVGLDFKLGKDRQGDIPFLEELGQAFDYSVKVVDLKVADDEIISSTRIRLTLAKAQIREVTRLLGNYYFLLGNVVKGAQRGHSIGFPTANISTASEKLLPPNGVYAVWIQINGQKYPAVANIGVRPTFDGTDQTVEVHIFDFNQDIYGQAVRVEFLDYIRPEQKFDGLDRLVEQINRDVQQARKLLAAEYL